MTNSFPANHDPESTVYDVNGNAVGTMADIYFDHANATSHQDTEPTHDMVA